MRGLVGREPILISSCAQLMFAMMIMLIRFECVWDAEAARDFIQRMQSDGLLTYHAQRTLTNWYAAYTVANAVL